MRSRLLVSLLGVVLALGAAAQAPTIDQSLNMKRASNPQISPDGRWVAYQVSETNWKENAFETEIWIAGVETGERYQLTRALKSSRSPRWSPDGQQLAFLSNREKKNQIYLISPTGGEARKLTASETGVRSFRWSPDGRWIAYSADEPEGEEGKKRKERYGEAFQVDRRHTLAHLWRVQVATDGSELPKPERLTEGRDFTVQDFSWSPDGESIAFGARRNPDPSQWHTLDLYVVTVAQKEVRKLVDAPGPDGSPRWSPDGKQIVYETSAGREHFYYTNSYIAVVPAAGGQPRVFNRALDEDANLIAWAPAGIYFSAWKKTARYLFRLNPATGTAERVTQPAEGVFSSFSFTKDNGRIAFLGAAPDDYQEVQVSRLAPFEPQKLTALGEQLAEFATARREIISWPSTDGTTIEGVLLKPPDFDASRKYPLLVKIHGGPTGIDLPYVRPDRYYPLEHFVAKGALVLLPNYRGSAGYGEKFRSLNVRNLGVGDYQDVLSGVDYLIAQGYVDRERVGAMGWSQGGYISAFITTYSDRFKAVSVGAGISDWMTYYVNTDIHPFTRQYLHATPWDDPAIYQKTSPISYVKKAQTPTLIQHGELDRRVPIPNAYELYQALQDQGVEVEMHVFKGFGHGINKPKEQRAVMEQNLRWFSRWIWNEEPEEAKD